MISHAAQRHQMAQLYLQLTWSTSPPRCAAIPRCDRCGLLTRNRAFIVVTWTDAHGWLCDACGEAVAPPGATIAPAPAP